MSESDDTQACIIEQLAERTEFNKSALKKVADMMVKLSEDLDTLDASNAQLFRQIVTMAEEMERYSIGLMQANLTKNVEFNALSTTHMHALEIICERLGLDWYGDIYPIACERAAKTLDETWKQFYESRPAAVPIVIETQRATVDRVWGLRKASLDKAAATKEAVVKEVAQ